MYQLKYDDEFTNIVRDVTYFKDSSDIPKHITDKFIEYVESRSIVLNNYTKKFNCIKCGCELDDDFYCKTCNSNYRNNYNDQSDEWLTSSNYYNYLYYVFDIIDNNVILYVINVTIDFWCYSTYTSHINKTIKFEIENAFFIDENGFRDLKTSISYNFDEYYDIYNCKYSNTLSDEFYQKYNIIKRCSDYSYIYKENLEDLKNTIYRYTYLWNAANILNGYNLSIKNLIFIPLYFKGFEYLMKLKLFNLAFNSPNIFMKNKTFNETFEIDKKYIPFMAKNNITWDELQALKVYPTNDITLIRFFSKDTYNIDNIMYLAKDLKIDLCLLRNYFIDNNMPCEYINEYIDYIFTAHELGIDLKDKDVIFPKDLLKEHDKLFVQIEVTRDPKIDGKIKSLSNIISINSYEDENYIIYPVSSISELVDESTQQHNCVRTYCDMISNNKCQIYLMRKKTDINKSFVTIEVRDTQIVQARVKYNNLPDKETNAILSKWEEGLIPVINKV